MRSPARWTSTSKPSRLAPTRTATTCTSRTSGPPTPRLAAVVDGTVSREMFLKDYASVFDGDHRWKGLDVPEGELFAWNDKSTYGAQADLLRRHEGHAGPGSPTSTAPACWPCWATRSPPTRHLPGRRVQGLQPGRQVPDRARRGAEELQLLRFPSRQPRDHGARYVRQASACATSCSPPWARR